MTIYKVLFSLLIERAERTHGKSQSAKSVSGPRFEPSFPEYESEVNHSVGTFSCFNVLFP